MEYSYIECSVNTNQLGNREVETFKWIGKSPYVSISNLQDKLQLGPYKLLLYKEDVFYSIYVRKDKFGYIRVLLYKSTRWLDLVYRRCIITLAVWNLANFHAATIPTWRDIKIFGKKHD